MTPSRTNYSYTIEMKVRDYECDLQGVVNNAHYQHYMEHARHEYLESLGGSFQQWHRQGLDAMVARIEIDYKRPLRSGDKFWVGICTRREGAKLIFQQDLFLSSNNTIVAQAKVHVVMVRNGCITRGQEFEELFPTKP